MRRNYRKPLVVLTSKKLLRFKPACSPMAAFDEGQRYLWVIPDDLKEVSKVTQLVFCSGQVYYEALEERKRRGNDSTALVRLEQLSPFPYDAVERELKRYPNARVTWL